MGSIAATPNNLQAPQGELGQEVENSTKKEASGNEGLPPHSPEFPIVRKSAQAKQENEQTERPGKYKYPEFAGPAGERYLLSLAEQFSPFALWRTWFAAVSYQGQGDQAATNTCYVGVSRLVERKRPQQGGIGVGVRERKVYLDFDAMEERDWLIQKRVRMGFVQEDGSTVYSAVTIKDFTGFYDTAYDYHLWLHSAEYLAPERENIPLILADPELTKRLIKFENYRRILVCGKPGPKKKESQDFYTCQLEQVRTPVQKVNLYSNESANVHSPNRIIITSDTSNVDVSSFSTSEKGTAGTAIRNEDQPETFRTEDRNETASKSKPNTLPPTNNQRGAARAEGLLGYTEDELKHDPKKRGAAAVGISADQRIKLQGGLDQAEQEERRRLRQELTAEEQSRLEREIPAWVLRTGEEYARQYDDPHSIPSDLTRFKKIYATAEQACADFSKTLYLDKFDAAKGAAAKYASKYRNSKGRVNRVPYFFTSLENEFHFSLEELVYLREDDPLYIEYSLQDVIERLQQDYRRDYQSGRTRLDYRGWLQNILDQLENCKKPKRRNNVTSWTYE